MGKNMAGLPEITFRGLDKGQKVRMRYAEVCYPDMKEYELNKGMVMMENIRAACAQDLYYAAGMEEETFAPHFTLHGYRYVEITGIPEPLPVEDVKGRVLSSFKLGSGFECSNPLVNRLWQNIQWTTLANFISYNDFEGFGGNNSMNSFNHYSFGAVGQWMMSRILGIERDDHHAGFEHFVLRPMPDPTGQMTFARGWYDVPQGQIRAGWEQHEGGFLYRFTIPAGCSATLLLDGQEPQEFSAGEHEVIL